ncbi:ecotin family protein [uncultured Porphyromonas sp.]|uniref:ecotin family protein n=1 Tax=uncultured Porphyromonas sp. TaxID=159274 RepID=UPI00260A16D0|nr:ecotin family protein [uncultured Porphyromonas sp.]
MTALRFTHSSLSLLLTSLLLLATSCRTTREGGQSSEEGAQMAEGSVVSYSADYSDVALPAHTYRLTLPHVSPLEDFRVELLPALPNSDPTHTSIDGRFITGEPIGEFSSFRYRQGEGIVTLFDKPIEGLDAKPYIFGEPLLLPFRGNKEIAVTTNDSIQVAYRYWRAMGKPVLLSPDAPSKKASQKKGYVLYTITAPERHKGDSPDYYIELIPSRRMKVDCNIHVLNGKFELDMEAEGLNLPYIFKSDGKTMSTRMGCPDDRLEEKLIRHMGLVVLRNAGESVMVYIPQGFSLLCRFYHPDGKRSLLGSTATSEQATSTPAAITH